MDWLATYYPVLGSKACALKLGRTINSVRVRANRLGAYVPREIANKLHSETCDRTYVPLVDETQFINPSTPEVAYLLGLLWADGWIINGRPGYCVNIKLVAQDMVELEPIFAKTGEWKRYYSTQKERKPTLQLTASNKRLVNHLLSVGYETKSHGSASDVIQSIPSHLRHYWWRGYLDGDGHVSSSQYLIHFSSSHEQDWSFLPAEIPFRICRLRSLSGSYSRATISRKEWTLKFGRYVYDRAEESGIYLPRKLSAFREMEKRANEENT